MSQTVARGIGNQVHQFTSYPKNNSRRSVFDRSHNLITTMNSGLLVPIWDDIAFPGDTLEIETSSLCRLATQIVPFMSNVYMDIHFWKVPIRILWEHWKAFNGERRRPNDSIDYLTPQITVPSSSLVPQSLWDYMDLPCNNVDVTFNAFLPRAYNYTWNEWYRDENLQDPVVENFSDTDSADNYTLLPRGKRKDYFTSALPFLQKGEAVEIPIQTTAPVRFLGPSDDLSNVTNLSNLCLFDENGGLISGATTPNPRFVTVSPSGILNTANMNGGGTSANSIVPYVSAYADMTGATGTTINQLRQAVAIQRVLEKDARGGTRYTEIILNHFGVQSPDARLQRPEFLGGGTFRLDLNIIPQTSSSNDVTPQGNLASYGVVSGTTKKVVTSFTEHCVVFALASIRSEYYYQQGLPRRHSYRNRYDFYLPDFAHLGEQAVLNKEIYYQNNSEDDEVFGYQERFAEMRYKNSRITGWTRSTAPESLDVWHLGQNYNALPKLNADFIKEQPPIERVIAVQDDTAPEFICNFYFNEKWTRPMPVYGIPSLDSHF